MSVLALAQPRASKVESQHGITKAIQRLRRMENNLVMQRPAIHRVGMTDQRRTCRVRRARFEQRLQPSGEPIKKK